VLTRFTYVFLLLARHLAEWMISFVKGVVSAYARGRPKSGHYHVVGGGSRDRHTGAPHVW